MKTRSKILGIATTLATAYTIYLIYYFIGGTAQASGTEALAGAIATALVLPHMLLFLIGAVFGIPILIFGFIGYAKQKKINNEIQKSTKLF